MHNSTPQSDLFSEGVELVHDLRLDNGSLVWGPSPPVPASPSLPVPAPPSSPATEPPETLIVPGYPFVTLSDQSHVTSFLVKEFMTQRLDNMRKYLWLMSSKNNINPLHHQAIKGRQILITENPDLHLVWYYDQIYIKPVPRFLLSYAFFKRYISGCDSREVRKAVNGFLRTYARLIVHESDFDIAKEKGLLPKDTTFPEGEGITWFKWCKYIEGFRRDFDEEDISDRHIYGEIRLTRLNFYSKVFCFEWNYFDTYTQYGLYFSRYMAPYLFVFGSISVVLTALQTTLAAGTEDMSYQIAARKFSNFSLWATGIGLLFLPLLYVFYQLRELGFAIMYSIKGRKA